MSTNIHSIATELKRKYLEEPYRNSETAKIVKMTIDGAKNERNDKGIDKHEAVVDYFEKRVKRTIEAFRKGTTESNIEKVDSSNILPKPVFDLLEYDKMACVRFLMAYLEESDRLDEKNGKEVSNRKAKYVYDHKVDLDKNYDFIYRVLEQGFIKPGKMAVINRNFYETYNKLRCRIIGKAIKDFDSGDKYYLINSKLYMRYVGIIENEGQINVKYVIRLAMLWLNFCKEIKSGRLIEDIPWGEKGGFRLLWKLWMWICMQTVCYILLEEIEKIDTGDLYKLKARMGKLEQEIDEKTISMNKSDEIFRGYFGYNFLLMVRDETIKDAELQQSLLTNEENKHYNLPDELCFVKNGNKLKEWAKSINETDKQKYFDFGDKKCTTQTFKKHISFCEEFVTVYNHRTGRSLNFNNLMTQRAVYRAFYVDKVKINRRDLVTIAKKIINEDKYEGIFTEHDLLGNVISSELLTEYYQGERILKIKNDIVLSIYSIGLKAFYRYFPCLEKNEKDFVEALDNLEFYFIETIDAIYENFYKK